jgi:hypothetical protein
MKKQLLRILSFVFVLLILWISVPYGFSNYDYDKRCTRCLREYHVLEKRFVGLTYYKSEELVFAGYDLADFTGTPCVHVYRTDGFGRETFNPIGGGMIADGVTAEGTLFRFRWEALKATFDLYLKTHNKELLKQSMDFIDSILPPDAIVNFLNDPRYKNTPYLMLLSQELSGAKSELDWTNALMKIKSELSQEK